MRHGQTVRRAKPWWRLLESGMWMPYGSWRGPTTIASGEMHFDKTRFQGSVTQSTMQLRKMCVRKQV